MSKSLMLALCTLLCPAATAQMRYDVYDERESLAPAVEVDTTLFYRAIQASSDLYGRVSRFALPDVTVKRRGAHYRDEIATVEGAEVAYRHFAALRALGAAESAVAGLSPDASHAGRWGGVRRFDFGEGAPLLPYRVALRFSDRNYRVGAQCSAAGGLGRGWSFAAAADLRTGRDMHVAGVFTNAATTALRVVKRRGDMEASATLCVPLSMRGLRSASTEEAFVLTGDRLYNPSWGYQNGKVRNARVRREALPMALATFRIALSPLTTLRACMAAEWGTGKTSALGWFDARTPLPDNYRNMPSYTPDRATEEVWRMNDVRYTQIDWDELIARNRLTGGEALYAVEDHAERLTKGQLVAAFSSRLAPGLTLRYGAAYRIARSRRFKRMRDLLGAERLTDIDQYLVDDDTYGNLLQNDLRHPARTVGRGDRFGYDYDLAVREAEAHFTVAYRLDRFRADAALMLGDATVRRRGRMEKELFPGKRSYGRSRRLRFTPYAVKAVAGWAFTPRSYLEATLAAGCATPEAEALFYQPRYNNRTVDDASGVRYYGAQAAYRLTTPVVEAEVGAFWTATFGEVFTQRYYDDVAGLYCNLAAEGIDRSALGAEAAVRVRLSRRWSLSAAFSAGRYRFIRNPRLTVLSDADNAAVDMRAECFAGDCRMGGAPELTACAEAGYFGPKGWGFRLSAGYAGARYVEPALLRRTERIARQGALTPETFDEFVGQERLSDAFTVDASLFKTFFFDRSRLTASLLLGNLTGGGKTVSAGYESMRVRRTIRNGVAYRRPHATRYIHAYPRSCYLSVAWKF